jgi:hypothetical protein
MNTPDGFVQIKAGQLQDLYLNAGFVVNEFSPFTNRKEINFSSEDFVIDQYYGQVYNTMVLRPAAIYGRSKDLPAYSGDELENYGFLRIPFRRIPRRIVHSRWELQTLLSSIKSKDSNLRILLRGQTHEHFINRCPETTQWLYGEDTVLEPSLQTSASRRKPALEEILPEWCALLKIFLRLEVEETALYSYDEFTTCYGFPLYSLALAQHYGLPTSGLDVTDNLDVALFFALMKYTKLTDSHQATYSRIADTQHMPVIYVLAPTEQQQFNYENLRTEGFPHGRPDAQSAHFLHIGWGYSNNACANRIFLALYLDPEGDFGAIPNPGELFPSGDKDRFATFLENEINIGMLPEQLERVLKEGFYTVSS